MFILNEPNPLTFEAAAHSSRLQSCRSISISRETGEGITSPLLCSKNLIATQMEFRYVKEIKTVLLTIKLAVTVKEFANSGFESVQNLSVL